MFKKLGLYVVVLGFSWGCFAQPPDIFLYTDRGTWEPGVENLNEFLTEHNYSFENKMAVQLQAGELATEKPQLLIIPGGESWVYLDDLKESGADAIKTFVAQGGSYLGICAGAFYATSHRKGGAATGPYGIGLLEGTAVDDTALNYPGYIEGVMNFHWELGNPFTQGLGSQIKMLLYGGPSFEYSAEESQRKQVQVVQRFAHSQKISMIHFKYGRGQVFLAAPHFEIKKEVGEEPKHDLAWPFLQRVLDSLMTP